MYNCLVIIIEYRSALYAMTLMGGAAASETLIGGYISTIGGCSTPPNSLERTLPLAVSIELGPLRPRFLASSAVQSTHPRHNVIIKLEPLHSEGKQQTALRLPSLISVSLHSTYVHTTLDHYTTSSPQPSKWTEDNKHSTAPIPSNFNSH